MGSWTPSWSSGGSRSCSGHSGLLGDRDPEGRAPPTDAKSCMVKLWYFPRGCAGHQESRQTLNLWVTGECPPGPKMELPKLLLSFGQDGGEKATGRKFWYRDPASSVSSKGDATLDRREGKEGVICNTDKPHLQMRKTEARWSSAQFKGAALVRGRAGSGT